MPEFAYKARNAQGGLVEGVLNCPDRGVAIRQIEQQNCTPIRIDPVMTTAPATAVPAAPGNFVPKIFSRITTERADVPAQTLKIPHSQLLIFTEQLAHLQQAGMTLDEGLGVLEKRLKHPRVQQMIRTLHQALVDGRSFSQALREFPRIFPPLYVNLVAVGEAPDAGKKSARSSATGADLSGFSYAGGRSAHYRLHYFHGAAAHPIHVAKWRRAAIADAYFNASTPPSHNLLVVGCPNCYRG